jgi:CheY-like chemotaxis protein
VLGVPVRAVPGGRDAIVELARAVPRLLLLDLRLPDVVGFAVIRWLAGRGSPVPVVAMSGAGEGALTNARALGCRACLAKPFTVDDLVAVVRRALAAPAGSPGDGAAAPAAARRRSSRGAAADAPVGRARR